MILLTMSGQKRIPLLISLLLHLFTCTNSKPTSSCHSSSCGNLRNISFPFRLKSDPPSCGYKAPYFELDCQNNQAAVSPGSGRFYYVQEINYEERWIWLVDPNINWGNLSSCELGDGDWANTDYGSLFRTDLNVPVAFIHCLSPINSKTYVKAPFCGNRKSTTFANSSSFFSYAVDGRIKVSDLEDWCAVDSVGWASTGWHNSSLESIYNGLAHGFKLSWQPLFCEQRAFSYSFCGFDQYMDLCLDYGLVGVTFMGVPLASYGWSIKTQNILLCKLPLALGNIVTYGGMLIALRFVIGFPLLVLLVVYKWRRRHLSMDKGIEDFLREHNYLAPIKYTYSQIKKMTNNFNEKLGEGGYGTVYKGKLRSGPYVAIKIMELSMAREEEFICEVGTIGCIHHFNVVQLIGFCVEQTKCALVYEFLPNGSLDRYIFNQQSLGVLALQYEKMLEIALGIARGINYLHRGCDVQILHFDIKPHNILLDEKFNPKISDFGLAQLCPIGNSAINLTAARGTLGYMAPEMFYRNIGGISYKADAYSFGMLLLEMAGRRKNMNPFVEDTGQLYFPSWAYDQLCSGNDIEIKDATEKEREMVKRIIIVALWCVQIRPSDRPPMDKVVGMLEGDVQLHMPPKPFFAPFEVAENDKITKTYSVDYVSLNLIDDQS